MIICIVIEKSYLHETVVQNLSPWPSIGSSVHFASKLVPVQERIRVPVLPNVSSLLGVILSVLMWRKPRGAEEE